MQELESEVLLLEIKELSKLNANPMENNNCKIIDKIDTYFRRYP